MLANGNRYEGGWEEGEKHGDGKCFYLDRGQLYIGVWVAGAAKCGEMIDLNREHAEAPTVYPIPEIGLADPKEVVAAARREHLKEDQPQQ